MDIETPARTDWAMSVQACRVYVSDIISTGHCLERGRAETQRRRPLAREVSALGFRPPQQAWICLGCEPKLM